VLGVSSRDEQGRGGYDPGVSGISSNGAGVRGQGTSAGVVGSSRRGPGVLGFAGFGRAGEFYGDVRVNGTLEKAGGGFRIDHPQNAEDKYLTHSFVESDDMKNVYDGVAILDGSGAASVDLPDWFEDLNRDFRYQLTAVGGAAPNLHVAEEVSRSRFKIAGGEGGMKVCWQVTGTRKDPWAAANPFVVEEEKPQEERGRYLDPALYDAPEEQIIMRPRMEAIRQPPQPPLTPQPAGFEPPTAPAMPPDVAAPGFGSSEEEHRRQIDELRGQIEEPRRGLEEEIDELRRQIKKLRRRQKRKR
jgi:hypothetical protein